ncbi:hypothetical protein C8R45DRAFT_943421 [Mycena sanguinolenta]|nr:hypothetical protein C8R45DRAFT_943421 [Mycena sanguinolenta]
MSECESLASEMRSAGRLGQRRRAREGGVWDYMGAEGRGIVLGIRDEKRVAIGGWRFFVPMFGASAVLVFLTHSATAIHHLGQFKSSRATQWGDDIVVHKSETPSGLTGYLKVAKTRCGALGLRASMSSLPVGDGGGHRGFRRHGSEKKNRTTEARFGVSADAHQRKGEPGLKFRI